MLRFVLENVSALTPADEVEKTAGALERGGLYTIIVVLAAVVAYLFIALMRERAAVLTMVVEMVKTQTQIITLSQTTNERIELWLTKVSEKHDKSVELMSRLDEHLKDQRRKT